MGSITARLTVWYASLLFLILLLTGGTAYFILRSALYNEAFAQVSSRALEARDLVEEHTVFSSEGLSPIELGIPGLVFTGGVSGMVVQVTNSFGRVLSSSPASAGGFHLPVPAEPTEEASAEISAEGIPMAWVSYPLEAGGVFIGSVQAAVPLSREKMILSQVRSILILVDLAGLILSLLVGYLIARAAMRPIDRLTRAAGRIGLREIGERLPVGRARDELYRLATTFNLMLERIQASVAAQQDFVAAASHELRTPLAIIQGNVSLLDRWGKDDPTVWQDSMDTIQEELSRMRRMIADLILLARDPSSQSFRREDVDLAAIVEDVAADGRVLSEGTEVAVGELADVTVTGDAEILKQSLLALVDNALKYTPPGGRVVLSLEVREPWAVLSVADNGPGIDPEDLPHIFDRFYRADKARTREVEGYGLGLSIVKMFVEQHGGRVEVDSVKGEGSTFRIWLPMAS